MKINTETEKLIFDAAETANSVGIESFVIDEHGIRGTDEGKQVVMLLTSFDLEVPFEGFGIGDVDQFVKRYNIHRNNEPKSIELGLDDKLHTKTVTLKSNNLKIEYRCLATKRGIQPTKLNDYTLCSFEITEEAIEMIKKGALTMKSDEVLFVKDEDSESVYLLITDINKSEFMYTIDGKFESEDDPCMFAHRYPIKVLLGALKDSDDNFAEIGVNGSLSIQKNGISIILPPRG